MLLLLQQFPSLPSSGAASFPPPFQNVQSAFLCLRDCKRPPLPVLSAFSSGPKLQFSNECHRVNCSRRSAAVLCTGKRPRQGSRPKKRERVPQNVDLPAVLPKKKKKPYPIPLKNILQAARADKKLAAMGMEKPLEPPKNGLLVPDLIPVAYEVLDAWRILIRGLTQILHTVPIHAFVELCIQAGVDLPEFPSRRRTQPVRMIGKKVIDRGGFVEEPELEKHVDRKSQVIDLDTHRSLERFPPPDISEVPKIAQETINAYEKVKWGVNRLMKKYTVKACGYCSEVHVGPWGHNAKLCGEFKHQWRDGKHGWQDATVDEVFPPNYVWHVRDPKGPPMRRGLKRFYGKAPAVVEVCMQAGAQVPERYKPMMRLDIVVPESEEAQLVA
ncbi:APO protein 1, chloroplastic isoform X4 [Coffea arabica]|uniref:APO protein 1, chloroplastic isoform X4 n=1 Tax=Coffea arabica TaxID=13443 RepID=A0A6P6WZG8_COFAR|nr:APO protein 1, chloroplastic-like isoform X1 [Coffea arabica]